jgi:dolichol-phosphate mannosyltransferase
MQTTTSAERRLLFIPMYNCERQIPRVLAKVAQLQPGVFQEVLVIDNGSLDNSRAAATEALKSLSGIETALLQNEKNYSLGGSHKVAFNYALDHGFDYVSVLHGDDQGDVRDLVPLFQSNQHRQYDCLLGARFLPESKLVNYSLLRTWGNQVFNGLFSLICGRRLHDLGAGLNIYRTEFLSSRFYLRFPNSLTFNYYMLLYSVANGARFVYFPHTWGEDDQVSNAKMWRQAWLLLRVLHQYRFHRQWFLETWHQAPQEYLARTCHASTGAACHAVLQTAQVS